MFSCPSGKCFDSRGPVQCQHTSEVTRHDDIVLVLEGTEESEREKQIRLGQERQREPDEYGRRRAESARKQDALWQALRNLKVDLFQPHTGWFAKGSVRFPGALPDDLQTWPIR